MFNNKERTNAMYHLRIFKYDIQLERYSRWTKFNYKHNYYDGDLWEVIIDFAWWRLFINK